MWETSFNELHNKGNLGLFHYFLFTPCLCGERMDAAVLTPGGAELRNHPG